MESNVEIFIENEEGNTFMLQIPTEITYAELKKFDVKSLMAKSNKM